MSKPIRLKHGRALISNALATSALGFALVLLLHPASAQETPARKAEAKPAQEAPAPPAADAFSDLEAKINQAAADLESSGLDEPFLTQTKDELDKARASVGQARQFRERAAKLEQSGVAAPDEVSRLEGQLAALGKPPELKVPKGIDALREQLETARAESARLKAAAGKAADDLTRLQARPVEVGARLPAASAELAQAETRLGALGDAAQESLVQTADRLALQAEVESLRAEVAMLGTEQVGQGLRERIATLDKELLEAQATRAAATVKKLEASLDTKMQDEIEVFRDRVTKIGAWDPKSDPELAQAARGLPELVDELAGKIRKLNELQGQMDRVHRDLENLQKDNTRLQRQAELGGLEGVFSQVLLDLRRRLPDPHGLDFRLKKLEESIAEAQLEDYRLGELRDEHRALAKRWADDPKATAMLKLRGELLSQLSDTQRSLIQDLARFGSDQVAYRDLTVEFSKFVMEQLFLRRSSKPVGRGFFTGLPASAAWLIRGDDWVQVGKSIATIPFRRPVATGFAGLAVLLLVAARRRLRSAIERRNQRIRRISTDRITHTLGGLVASLLLALALPIVLGFVSWGLASDPDAPERARGLATGLAWSAWFLGWILFLGEIARPQGIGPVHLGWTEHSARLLRRTLYPAAAWFVPSLLLVSITIFEDSAVYFDSLGRLAFIIAQVGIASVFARMLHPPTGVFSPIITDRPERLMSRLRWVWFGLAVGVPLALAVLAAIGYSLTALMLQEEFQSSLRWVAGGVVGYGVLLRWFMIKQRRLTLAQAIRERKARREPKNEPQDTEEIVAPVDEDDIELDLDDIARQTRRLLRSLVSVGVIVAIAYAWAGALPLAQVAEHISIPGGLSWLGLVRAALVLTVTFTVVKNLPGLLDLGGLRESGIAPGTRYAVAALSQYAAAAIGMVLLSRALDVDWSRFGWIAAALSVGLGFGLQEIVANFVCGIIILFERPVRVGDVVTVGQVTGSVSRIRMRATTITNWDRQEYVVPNKDFITGSLINWTLSSPLNRLTIPVGVAYGSDTARARSLLEKVAVENPLILEDPAPIISFEQFGDSTLNLVLRCYLPTMENRLKVTTELHEGIAREFQQAGIEIAFPQLDLHLRTVPGDLLKPAGGAD
ncbi:mechanosensitive ion channel domain-containing protein [Haloferula sargassicola]|uniref:Miniconductance mechanosensitive channel MscM n=1 Tax=Haloferula sargassicola TaxID=490096 RepID=A0ABP9UQY5_9BACT